MTESAKIFKLSLLAAMAAALLYGCANAHTVPGGDDKPQTDCASVTEEIIKDIPEEKIETVIDYPMPEEEPKPDKVQWEDIEPADFDVMPSNTNDGDQNHIIYSTVNGKLNYIDMKFVHLIGGSEVLEPWLYERSSSGGVYTAIDEAANLYSFIRYFDIPDETVREILVGLRNGREDDFTDEEIDLILSDDTEAVAAHFASETAIRKGDNLYSLYWIYSHPISDYISNGITPEDLESRVPYYNETPMSLEAKAAMKGKIEAYASGDYELTQAQAPAVEDNSGAEE